jgi:hypothetical protein
LHAQQIAQAEEASKLLGPLKVLRPWRSLTRGRSADPPRNRRLSDALSSDARKGFLPELGRRSLTGGSFVTWRDHPAIQAAESFRRLIQFPFIGIDHVERVFLASTIPARYGGSAEDPVLNGVITSELASESPGF